MCQAYVNARDAVMNENRQEFYPHGAFHLIRKPDITEVMIQRIQKLQLWYMVKRVFYKNLKQEVR